MNWESIGFGAGSGFMVSLLAALGWNRRINRLEDGKQDKGTCQAIHQGTEQRLERIENKLDSLSDYIRNHRASGEK